MLFALGLYFSQGKIYMFVIIARFYIHLKKSDNIYLKQEFFMCLYGKKKSLL